MLELNEALRGQPYTKVCGAVDAAQQLEVREGPDGAVLASLDLHEGWLRSGGRAAGEVSRSGTARHFRIVSGGRTILRGDIGGPGAAGDITLSETSLDEGHPLTLACFTLLAPRALNSTERSL